MAPCSLAPWPLAQSLRTGKNAAWPHDNVDSVGGGSGIKVGKVGGRWRDFDAGCRLSASVNCFWEPEEASQACVAAERAKKAVDEMNLTRD